MKAKKRKPYKTIAFKLSWRQYKSLTNFCKHRNTTPVKLIKKNMAKYINSYSDESTIIDYVTPNQIDLF